MSSSGVLNDTWNVGDSIRETITKTARYVADNGSGLEEDLMQDPRFSFVKPGDENFAYYQEILSKQRSFKASEDEGMKQDRKCRIPQEPYPFSFSNHDEDITQRDLEIIKLAAAYCVANESTNYLQKMRDEFKEDELFGFLNNSHALHGTFIQFVNQYKQVKSNTLGPPFFDWKIGDYKFEILQRSFQRAEFNVYSKELKSERDRASHLRKVQFAAFDWANFKVVNKVTVPTTGLEDLPQPLDFKTLASKRLQKTDLEGLFDAEKQEDSKAGSKTKKRKLRAAGSTRLKMRQVDSASRSESDSKFIKCPITQKLIPEDAFDKHLQVLLVDPHYKADRERYEAKHKLTNLRSTEVYENIKRVARHSESKV